IDSWFSVGAGCNGKIGVRKTADTDGTLGNANGILLNTDPSIGFPINGTGGRDGLATGVPVGVTFVGINNTGNGDLGVFDGTSQVGGLFTTNNGSIAALGGATGLDTTNIVLVGQFTTNGIFQYELNVQIGTPAGGTQNFVSSNPVGTEILASFLTGTLGAPNAAPTVSITAPANGSSFITGSNVSITANASDADGTVSQVEFFVDGVSIGVDNTAPYTASYTAVAGTRSITARATDDQGAQTTSSAVSITVAANPPPTCSITSPANGASFVVGDAVSIAATATDNGFVTQVDFFVDGILLSTDVTAPYTATYTATLGSHTITARATDNASLTTTSSAVTISVVNNVPPTVSITSPANGANFTFPASVTINATASDADGSVSSVGFYVNGSLVGTDNTSPYSFTWTSVIGTASLTAIATDNRG
ncbi:MAG: Ig-like domain-containing protein, partial [Bacteroidota bacterium]